MTPAELVGCIDFRYMTDVLTPEQAVDLLESRAHGKAEREAELCRDGLPAYTTSVGWLGSATKGRPAHPGSDRRVDAHEDEGRWRSGK